MTSPAAEAPRSLAGGALLSSAARISFVISGATVSILVARLLGPAGAGQFAVVGGLFFTLLALFTFGLEFGVGWMISSRRWTTGSALATSAVAALGLGLVGAVVGAIIRAAAASSAFEGIGSETVLLAMAGLAPGLLVAVFVQAALAAERYEAAAVISMIQALFYVAGVAALAAIFGLDGAVAGLVAGQVAGAVAALVWGASTIAGERRPRMDVGRLREAFTFGVQLHVANAIAVITYRFDVFLLNAQSGSSEAGYYAVAIAMTTALGVLPAALGNVLFPRLASYESGSAGELPRRQLEDRAIRHTLLILLFTTALLAAAIPLLTEPVFGSSFGPAVAPALLLIPGAAALGFAVTVYSALAGRGRPDYAMRISLAMLPLAIGLYFALIPEFEAEGAAVASDIAYGFSALLAFVSLRRVAGNEPRDLLPGRAEFRDYRDLLLALRRQLGREEGER
jgi:O-antigen/teichoic acid export membrane protein